MSEKPRISITIDEYNMLNTETLQQRNTIAALTARVEELEEALKVIGYCKLSHSAAADEENRRHARAALTKGERTPSFGDFVEGCDYLPVPSTKGESHD